MINLTMKDKKNNNLFAKHVIEQITPLFEEFFKSLDKNFDQINYDDISEIYLKDLKNYTNNFKNNKKTKKINPYSAFLSDKLVQEKIKKKNPNLSFGQLSKLKGHIWKNFPEEEKQKYKLMAQESNCKNDSN
jgi:hypothetical protein